MKRLSGFFVLVFLFTISLFFPLSTHAIEYGGIGGKPAYPTADEIRNIKSRAGNLNRIAYVAQVQIDSAGNLKKEIAWTRP